MKTITLILLFFILIFSYDLTAQNLVPNSSFELLNETKRGYVTIECSKDWFSSYMMATDYYNRLPGKWKSVPKNVLGYQEPHSGDAYAGICIDSKFIEYLQTKLLDTLIAGKKYLIEFYISRAEKSKSNVKEFGVLFSDAANKAIDANGIAKKPSVKFINRFGYRDKKGWTKLSAVYQAKGFETYLILGYFTYDHPGYHKKYCHYYIDDVSIIPMEKENNSNIKTENSTPIAKTETPDSISQLISPKPGETITLKNIFFESNKTELLSPSFPELDKLIQYLNKEFNTTIEISGHTDNTGNENQNKILSEARAKAVKDYLISKGIDGMRIKYIGYGSAKPITTNSTDEGKQLNRRVEFTIYKK